MLALTSDSDAWDTLSPHIQTRNGDGQNSQSVRRR